MVSGLARHVDSERIVRAIKEAEVTTSGEIRVSLAPHFWGSIRKAAERAFVRLGMSKTPQRNGVLLFIVPARREFVILGDVAIHERVGQEFWEQVAAAMTDRIRSGDLTEGIIHGVQAAGLELARHFPPAAKRGDGEGLLPDDVER